MSGSQRRNQQLGVPDLFGTWSPFPFAGVNQKDSRVAMDDTEFYWLENLITVGKGKKRAMWDCSTAFYAAPAGKMIVFFFWFNIGAQEYVAVFFNDGTANQVAWPSGAVTAISSTPNTFYVSTTAQLPACSQSGTQYLLISNHNTENDYWIWDGTVLYGAGSIGPFTSAELTSGGAGYSSVPSYTVYGGTGSGVVLTPVINEGSVVSLTVDNPGSGYSPGDIVQVAFEGGGSDNTPILEAVLASGVIEFLTLVAPGSGYTNGTYALGFSGGGGSGAAGTFTVTSTTVSAVTLTNGGSGYTSAPTISFPGAGGSGAEAVASLTPGAVASVNIIDGGTNLTGTPTLTFAGGGGSGAQAVATVTSGSISAVTVTNGGSGYITAPAVEVQSGLNNAASAILQLMPFGVSGTTIETWQQRVWLGYPNQVGQENNGGTFFISAPGSLTDFATSDGGDIFTNTDRFLRVAYTFFRQTSNFIYFVGDSSTSSGSNVQTQGNPPSTTFSYQNVDPQIGSPWRDTAQDFGNTILFANPLGVFGVYGGSVRKVSEKLDDLFNNAMFPPVTSSALTPTSAVASVYDQKIYLLLLTISDPFTQKARNVMVFWDGKEWGVASQTPALTFIGTREIASALTAWGTDGTNLYQLFATPSTIAKVISTKQYGANKEWMLKTFYALWLNAIDKSSSQTGLSFSGSVDSVGVALPVVNPITEALQSIPSGSYPFPVGLNFVAPQPLGAVFGIGAATGLLPVVPAVEVGVTLASSSEDFEIVNLNLGYQEGPFNG